jgi:hypothetical protein
MDKLEDNKRKFEENQHRVFLDTQLFPSSVFVVFSSVSFRCRPDSDRNYACTQLRKEREGKKKEDEAIRKKKEAEEKDEVHSLTSQYTFSRMYSRM